MNAHTFTEVNPDPRRQRMLDDMRDVRPALDKLEARVALYGADYESRAYADFLKAVYDLTEIEAVYERAQEIMWPLDADAQDFFGNRLGTRASREASAAWDLSK